MNIIYTSKSFSGSANGPCCVSDLSRPSEGRYQLGIEVTAQEHFAFYSTSHFPRSPGDVREDTPSDRRRRIIRHAAPPPRRTYIWGSSLLQTRESYALFPHSYVGNRRAFGRRFVRRRKRFPASKSIQTQGRRCERLVWYRSITHPLSVSQVPQSPVGQSHSLSGTPVSL